MRPFHGNGPEAFLLYTMAFFRYKQTNAGSHPVTTERSDTMDPARRAGIVVVFGIPAIVGSGLIWQLAGTWQAVVVYLGLLGFVLLAFLANPEGVFWKKKHSE
jgi:hypothetical protein